MEKRGLSEEAQERNKEAREKQAGEKDTGGKKEETVEIVQRCSEWYQSRQKRPTVAESFLRIYTVDWVYKEVLKLWCNV